MVFFDEVVLPLPSSELWDSVVLSVPGAGATIAGTVVDVDEVVLDVVCAKAAPAIRNKAPVLAIRNLFMVILRYPYRTKRASCCIGNSDALIQSADMGGGNAMFEARKLLMLPRRKSGCAPAAKTSGRRVGSFRSWLAGGAWPMLLYLSAWFSQRIWSGIMRKIIILGFLLSATAAYAQLSEPKSEQAGNILNGSPDVANQLPAPRPGASTIAQMLTIAVGALQTRHTGAAQEALEQAETMALDRSVPQSESSTQITDPLVTDIFQARQALGAKDIAGALHSAEAARVLAQNI